MKSELSDFISTKCLAAKFFDRTISFMKMADQSYVWNRGAAKYDICGENIKIENISDMYEHLFETHKEKLAEAMILSALLTDHIMYQDIMFVKEEVCAVAAISNCVGFGWGVLTECIREMVKKRPMT